MSSSHSVRFAPEEDFEEFPYEEEEVFENNDTPTGSTTQITEDNNINMPGSENNNSNQQKRMDQQESMLKDSMSKLICPSCGSTNIEQHGASGASVCTECAIVVEENAIVSSVDFVEGAGGQASAVGQFVSGSSTSAFGSQRRGKGGGTYGFSRDSRETTLANGRRRILEVAQRLRLRNHLVDSAHRHFTMAVERNFVQGRRTTHVVASCLYMACRQEKNNQHMLIDFSDALQVNVYTLGTCFLKFRRLVGIKLQLTDPALYVHRFAAFLDLDDKANAVAYTALRIVGRMNRDWLVAGRRPAGICAAALLIAARAHGFSRSQADVTRVLRVCGMTVNARMKEFEYTPSAQLTLEQFKSVEIEDEADPPSFTRNRYQEARAKAIQDGNTELLESGDLNHPLVGKLRLQDGKSSQKQTEISTMYKDLQTNMESDVPNSSSQALVPVEPAADDDVSTEVSSTIVAYKYPKGNNSRPLVLPDDVTQEEQAAPVQAVEESFTKNDLEVWMSEMPKDSAEELDDYFLSDHEVKKKELIFNRLHKDYLVQLEKRQADMAKEEEVAQENEVVDAAQAEGHARYMKASRSRRGRNSAAGTTGSRQSTEEALLGTLANKRISRKINYDAMSALFDSEGGFSTENLGGVKTKDEGVEEEIVEEETIFSDV